jgi:pimeloyl-ACP methyl ester carboxylesterase
MRWLLLLLMASSCRLVHANREFSVFSETVTRISGTVHGTSDVRSQPILVVAFQQTDEGPRVVNYEVLLSAGVYNLLLPAGKFRVFAFEDLNQDFAYQPGEQLGELRSGIELVEGNNIVGLDIQLGAEEIEHPRIDLSDAGDNPMLGSFRQTTGDVVSLDEKRFSRKSGVAGMWRPLTALERDQMGVFLLEPYDPCKTPVLFVHGMEGSPQDLRPLIEALDRKKFQPWFLAYPSGLRLRFVSVYLAEAIRELGVRHKPYRMYVVAHSMGGLIARSFINQNVAMKRRQLIRLFVSISTPFNGHAGAKAGVRFSPVVAPAWIDMVPNSAFIKHLYEEPLEPYVEHHLFFGFRGTDGASNDGVVFLSSALDPRAQFAARGVYGYDEDHSSILSSKDVIQRTIAIVEAKDAELGALEGCQPPPTVPTPPQ